jgi:hypothetical protein
MSLSKRIGKFQFHSTPEGVSYTTYHDDGTYTTSDPQPLPRSPINRKQLATLAGTLGLASVFSEIGSLGVIGGGIAIGVPVIATVGVATAIGAGACYLLRDNESTTEENTVPPTEVRDDYDEITNVYPPLTSRETIDVLNEVY